jgi:CHAT domain-containing protein
VTAVAERLQQVPTNGDGWMRAGEGAREALVTADPKLSEAQILVFATHGLLAKETLSVAGLEEPALLLSPNRIDHAPDWDDGLLTASEITLLRLKADWVVLVACNSAGSDGTDSGEALSGLAASFIQAGAQGVIVSYWPIDALTSIGLIREIFTTWNGGKIPMEQALSLAMQRMREGAIFPGLAQRTEYHWAPLVVMAP